MSGRRWVWAGGGVTVVAVAGLGVYFTVVGLNEANQLASVLGTLVAVVGLAVSAYGLAEGLGGGREARQAVHLFRPGLGRTSPIGPGEETAGADHVRDVGGIIQVGRDLNVHHHHGTGRLAAPRVVSLPAASPYLVGRDRQVREVLALLAPDGERTSAVVVSAVHGLAGIGKTALALHAARQAVADGWFDGGALFVGMAGYDPAGGVSVGQAVGMLLRGLGMGERDLPPTVDEQVGLWQAELARRAAEGRRVLVVADNVSTADQVRPLVPASGVHRLLVTSRDTLASLTAVGARLIGLEELDMSASAGLIRTAILRAYPADARPGDETAALERVARLCGRLPLALQIAAAILVGDPGMPIHRLADRLADERTRLDRLRPPDQETEGGSASVRAAFTLSYQRLNPAQQRVFQLMGLNPGPHVTTEAAAALTRTRDEQAADTDRMRPVLAAVARAGLVTEAPAGSGRWRMHDLIKVYAAELAHDGNGGESAAALLRLLDHYLTTATIADAHLSAPPGVLGPGRFADRDAALAWLDTERPNLIAALAQTTGTSPRIAIDLATCLIEYLGYWRRLLDDALAVSRHALSAAHELGDRRGEGMALNNLGLALQETRRYDEAIDAHTQDLDICRELGDRRGEGVALNNLGLALQDSWRYDEAISAHTQAVDIARELNDPHGEGMALDNLGLALQETRRYDEAIDAHTRSAVNARAVSDRHGEGLAMNNLGLALQEAGRYDEAIDAHTEDLGICRELGDRRREGATMDNLGLALRQVRRFEEAISAHLQAAAGAREVGDHHGEGAALNNLGLALQDVRQFEHAVNAHTQAATIARKLNDRHGEGGALDNLGLALQEVGRLEDAVNAHTQAAAIARELGDHHGEGAALNNLGLALQEARRLEDAVNAHTQAAAIARELGDHHGESMALNNLGLALQETRRYDEAIDAHTRDLEICRELGDQHGEGLASDNLGTALREVRRFDEAIAAHTQATAIARELGDRHREGMTLNNLGSALRHLRRFDKAISAHTQAITIFRELGDRHGENLAREDLQRARQMRRSDGGRTRGYRRKLTGRERER